MQMFQSEWLREPAHPVPGSYAKPAYGTRYARKPAPVDVAIELPAPPHPECEEAGPMSLPACDRAA